MEITETTLKLAAGFVTFVTTVLTLVITFRSLRTRRETTDGRSNEPPVRLVALSREVEGQFGPSSSSSPPGRVLRGGIKSLCLLLASVIAIVAFYYVARHTGATSSPSYFAAYTVFFTLLLLVYAFFTVALWHLGWLIWMGVRGGYARLRKRPQRVPRVEQGFMVAGNDVHRVLEHSTTVLVNMRANIVLIALNEGLVRATKGPSAPTFDYSGLVDEITVSVKAEGSDIVVTVSSVGVRPGIDGDQSRNQLNVDRFVNDYLGLRRV